MKRLNAIRFIIGWKKSQLRGGFKIVIVLIENLKKIEQIWKSEGLKLGNPPPENLLVESFSSRGILISKDVIDIYSNLGGMTEDGIDDICFTFWRVDKILAEYQPNSGLTFFADFLIYSHLYGFKFENEHVSSIHIYWGKNQIEKVADSFSEFLKII